MTESDKRFNIVDEKTPSNVLLTAHYRRSFAYYTIRDRLPVILTHIIDQLARDRDILAAEYGDDSREELKEIVGCLSQLKYELQTDKEFRLIDESSPDHKMWNNHIREMADKNTYYSAIWLHAECYLYRRIRNIFEVQSILQNYDYFQKQKENAFTSQCVPMKMIAKHIENHRILLKENREELEKYFVNLIKMNLWGNRCDLSISAGVESETSQDPIGAIKKLDPMILANDIERIWKCISDPSIAHSDVIIDFICDNSGYELFTDLCIADFMIEHNLAKCVRFYVKQLPWFISDVMPTDYLWTLRMLRTHTDENLSKLGQRCSDYLLDGRFKLMDATYFWTTGYSYERMKEIDECLYKTLSEAHLIVFKGDLNYRKLLGEMNWEPTTSFDVALQGFRPSNVCSLRTVKADLICGLKPGVAQKLNELNPQWMENGDYGVIQFAQRH